MSSVERTLAKLQTHIDAGNMYEAQQIIKCVSSRHRSRKQLESSYDLLARGAQQQLKAHQLTCGVELALLLLKAYTDDELPVDDSSLSRVYAVYDCFPPPPSTSSASAPQGGNTGVEDSPEVAAVSSVMRAALTWANKQCSAEAGVLYDKLASYLFAAGGWRSLGRAAPFFARASDKVAYARVLQDCMSHGPNEERGLFVCRALLQTLAAATPSSRTQQLEGASALLDALQPVPHLPLCHFSDFLMNVLRNGSGQLYDMLRAKYAPSLAMDPSLASYLTRVEETYLGRRPPPDLAGGMLGSMLSMLTGEA